MAQKTDCPAYPGAIYTSLPNDRLSMLSFLTGRCAFARWPIFFVFKPKVSDRRVLCFKFMIPHAGRYALHTDSNIAKKDSKKSGGTKNEKH